MRIIVGFAAGGGSDFIARLLAQKLTETLGQTVIVENRPGAGGNLAADMALTAPADGYTLLLTAASYTVNPALYKLSFDPIKDMTPIAQLARGSLLELSAETDTALPVAVAASSRPAPGPVPGGHPGKRRIARPRTSPNGKEAADVCVVKGSQVDAFWCAALSPRVTQSESTMNLIATLNPATGAVL